MLKILSLFWCFILTIWNVNGVFMLARSVDEMSFILTIWNVNSDKGVPVAPPLAVLY